jgi:hypothetical protein
MPFDQLRQLVISLIETAGHGAPRHDTEDDEDPDAAVREFDMQPTTYRPPSRRPAPPPSAPPRRAPPDRPPSLTRTLDAVLAELAAELR